MTDTSKSLLKPGTRIEMNGFPAVGGFAAVAPEMATIAQPRKEELPLPEGWHIVKFAGGGKLCVHETSFRVIEEKAK